MGVNSRRLNSTILFFFNLIFCRLNFLNFSFCFTPLLYGFLEFNRASHDLFQKFKNAIQQIYNYRIKMNLVDELALVVLPVEVKSGDKGESEHRRGGGKKYF